MSDLEKNLENIVENKQLDYQSEPETEEIQTIEDDIVETKKEQPVTKINSNVEIKQENVDDIPKEESEDNNNFISDTFSQLMSDNETLEEMEKNPSSTKNILGNIKVDLNSIEFTEELDPLQMATLENSILDDKTTMLVTCCQSSYTAELSALKSQEIQSLSNSDVDYYSYKKKLFQLINKHMETTSVGKINFGKFLHVTSYFDIDTLLYGIYCQTFNYENKYSITCPKCRSRFDAIVNNNTLIELRGEEKETFAKIQEIVNSVKDADKLVENSHVHKTKRIILDESRIIFDIRIPSAYDYLEEVVAKSDDDALEEYQNSLGLALFVNQIYLPNLLLYKQTGELKYIKLNLDKAKLLSTIANLSYYDSLQLSDEINDFVEKYRVTYSIRNITCPHCGHVIGTIPIDMEEMLFNTIRRGRIGR